MTMGTNTWKMIGRSCFLAGCPLLYPFPFSHLHVLACSLAWLLTKDSSTWVFIA